MYLLPQFREFLKMPGRNAQDLLDVGPFGIRWTDGILPIRYCNGSVQPKIAITSVSLAKP